MIKSGSKTYFIIANLGFSSIGLLIGSIGIYNKSFVSIVGFLLLSYGLFNVYILIFRVSKGQFFKTHIRIKSVKKTFDVSWEDMKQAEVQFPYYLRGKNTIILGCHHLKITMNDGSETTLLLDVHLGHRNSNIENRSRLFRLIKASGTTIKYIA